VKKSIASLALMSALVFAAVVAQEPQEPELTIAEAIADNPNLGMFLEALETAGLVELLQQDGPFTVFAPANEAFEGLSQEELDELLADPEALAVILNDHIVSGAYSVEDLAGMPPITTLQDRELPISMGDDPQFTVNVGDANIIVFDIIASNGIIHIIDSILYITDSE
jgi:uncharacterized surface protein with fasciclin (FAS1) repeats